MNAMEINTPIIYRDTKRPTMIFLRLVLFLVLGVASAAGQQQKPAAGAEILAPFKKNLQTALITGLAEGPEKAIQVCSMEAPIITESVSKGDIIVGRTSDRLRNPSNISPEWVKPILETYLNSPQDRTAKTIPLENGQTGYVEAIILQPVCLACHGETLSAGISNTITDLYPNDQAIGYQVGDLRGVFWVTY
ncbi:MAG: DUF3365 domain-containing protein [Acidiferrobacterales bacterium]|nr:DUF3365 domain-containing protein [Acidiferrobacterales bacterium]